MNKKNKIVQYNNEMNNFSFGKFKEKELDLFFSICFKAKEQGLEKIEIPFSELKELSNYSNRNLVRFVKDLEATYDKLMDLKIKKGKDELNFIKFNLFDEYEISSDNRMISIQVNKKFEYLLNNILKLGNYTKFDLIEFVSLKSSYSKNMFRLLKQWDNTRKWRSFQIEDFRNLLSIPVKYRMSEIDKYVLAPIMDDLPKYFEQLKLEKIKEKNRVVELKFTWKGKIDELEEAEIIEVEISQKLSKTIEKTKKNKFITSILTDENIHKLINKYKETDLIKGLDYAYKTVKQVVPNLTYLFKIIETGTKKDEIKIKVKQEKKVEKKESEIERVEIVTSSKEQGSDDSLYQMFLNSAEDVQEPILEKAKILFLKEVGAENMNKMYEKFFNASKKEFIIKAIRVE